MPYNRDTTVTTLEEEREILRNWSNSMFTSPADADVDTKTIAIQNGVIGSLAEFMKISSNFIMNMSDLHALLEALLERTELTSEEILTCKKYMENIERTILAFQDLTLIEDACNYRTPEQTLTSLTEKVSSPEFFQFIEAAATLTYSLPKMQPIYDRHRGDWDAASMQIRNEIRFDNFVNINSFITNPFQYISRLAMMCENIRKFSEKQQTVLSPVFTAAESADEKTLGITAAEKLHNRALELTRDFNSAKGSLEDMTKETSRTVSAALRKDPNVTLCKKVLELNLNNPLVPQLTNNVRLSNFDSYVDTLVGEIAAINHEYNPFESPDSPLFLVLQSTNPISESFSPEDKIRSYIEVAALYAEGKLGKREKYLGAYEMAERAYAVARQYPTPAILSLVKKAFSPYATEDSISTQCENHQFGNWIVSKARKYHNQHVDNTFLENTNFGRQTDISPAKDSGFGEFGDEDDTAEAHNTVESLSSPTLKISDSPPAYLHKTPSTSSFFKPVPRPAQKAVKSIDVDSELDNLANEGTKRDSTA